MTHVIQLSPSEVVPASDSRLSFVEKSLAGARQRRHLNRTILEPELDLGRFKCSACMDVVDLSFDTIISTDFKHIRKLLGPVCGGAPPYVERLNGTDNSANSFVVTVQSPTIAKLKEIEKALASASFGVAGQVSLLSLEVSIDFFPLNSSALDREVMVGLLHRTYAPKHEVWNPPQERPRFVFIENGASGPTTHHMYPNPKPDLTAVLELERIRSPRLDSTVYLGSRSGPVLVRIQNKISDNRRGSAATVLPVERRRARVEVNLSGEELLKRNLRTVDDLVCFSFRSLQGDFFHFALPTFRDPNASRHPAVTRWLNDNRRRHFLATGIVGLRRCRKLREQWLNDRSGRRIGVSPVDTLNAILKRLGRPCRRPRVGTGMQGDDSAYQELNRKISDALSNLQKRERRGAKT